MFSYAFGVPLAMVDESARQDLLSQVGARDNEAQSTLVIGLTGAAGINFDSMISALREAFRDEIKGHGKYDFVEITLAHLLNVLSEPLTDRQPRTGHELRVWDLMNVGNAARHHWDADNAVIVGAIQKVWEHRQSKGAILEPVARTVYVLDRLKRPEEIEDLRRIYGDGCIIIAGWAPEHMRIQAIARKIAKERGFTLSVDRMPERQQDGSWRPHVEKIELDCWHDAQAIQLRDDSERHFMTKFHANKHWQDHFTPRDGEDNPWMFKGNGLKGADVRSAFPMADVFVNTVEESAMKKEIRRIVRLLLGDQFITPTRQEHAMALAEAARLRSADTGLQVGAAVLGKDGEILGVGANEVPKPRGGQYWPVDEGEDWREHRTSGIVLQHQRNVIEEIVDALTENPRLSIQDIDSERGEANDLDGEKLKKRIHDALQGTRARNLIEFFRTTHAELAAIIDALKNGGDLRGASLCSTTFPCHECTRHIIHAGITQVYFIEPYAKSLGQELYPNAACMECTMPGAPPQDGWHDKRPCEDCDKVHFWPFTGVGPRLYHQVFRPTRRRNEDRVKLDWRHGTPTIKSSTVWSSILLAEIETVLQANGWRLPEDAKIAKMEHVEGIRAFKLHVDNANQVVDRVWGSNGGALTQQLPFANKN